jgi:hypothetical protein
MDTAWDKEGDKDTDCLMVLYFGRNNNSSSIQPGRIIYLRQLKN